MGKKIVGVYCTLCVFSFCLISIACFSKWHQVTFKTLHKTVFRMETTLTRAVIPSGSKLFCGTFTSRQPKRCAAIQEGVPLQEAASDWCAPFVASFFPAPCIAFNRAYVIGMAVIMMYGLNMILLLTSAFLLYHYLESKNHKPLYRTWAMICHGVGTFMIMGAVISYSVFAVSALDAIGGSGLGIAFDASQSVGISWGYFLVWVGILCQLIAFGMHACMRLSNEQTEEQKMYKDMLKEQQAYGAMEAQAASFQGGYQDGASSFGYNAAGSYTGGYDAAAGYGGYGNPPAYPAYGGAAGVPPAPAADFGMPPPGAPVPR